MMISFFSSSFLFSVPGFPQIQDRELHAAGVQFYVWKLVHLQSTNYTHLAASFFFDRFPHMNEITTIACGTRIEIMEDRQDEIHDRAKLTRESLESPSHPNHFRAYQLFSEIFCQWPRSSRRSQQVPTRTLRLKEAYSRISFSRVQFPQSKVLLTPRNITSRIIFKYTRERIAAWHLTRK